jgi:hypothetical protein
VSHGLISVEHLFSMTLLRGGVHHHSGDERQRHLLVAAARQGLTLVHFSAQPEPYLSQKHPYNGHPVPLYRAPDPFMMGT